MQSLRRLVTKRFDVKFVQKSWYNLKGIFPSAHRNFGYQLFYGFFVEKLEAIFFWPVSLFVEIHPCSKIQYGCAMVSPYRRARVHTKKS
ncbi:hypothetical protein D3C81_1882020 [compost metagenome]